MEIDVDDEVFYSGNRDKRDNRRNDGPFNQKEPPDFNPAHKLWFTYERQVKDWCLITIVDEDKRGPLLKTRLSGSVLVYAESLEPAKLCDKATGVQYLLDQLRPHYLRGAQPIFLHRFFKMLRSWKGSRSLSEWLPAIQLEYSKTVDAWMQIEEIPDRTSVAYQDWLEDDWGTREKQNKLDFHTEQTNADNQYFAQGNRGTPPRLAYQSLPRTPDTDANFEKFKEEMKDKARKSFPIGDHLMALMIVVMSDIKEDERVRLFNYMKQEKYTYKNITMKFIYEAYDELFSSSKAQLLNPTKNQGNTASAGGPRSFLVEDSGFLTCNDGMTYEGCWAQDEESGEQGFLEQDEDVFWVYEEPGEAFIARRFKSAIRRKSGKGGKGKGKGKGSKGRKFFRRKKGKGRGYQANADDWEYDSADWSYKGSAWKGKGKGKDWKGKGKGKGKEKARGNTPAARA